MTSKLKRAREGARSFTALLAHKRLIPMNACNELVSIHAKGDLDATSWSPIASGVFAPGWF